MLKLKSSTFNGVLLLFFTFFMPSFLVAQDEPAKPDSSETQKSEEADEQEKFERCDIDGDNKITKEEFTAYLNNILDWFTKVDQAFTELDKNKDDVVSREEFAKRRAIVRKITSADKAAERKSKRPKAKEFADIYNEKFMQKKPDEGDIIPEDLTAFNEKGEKLSFKDLRGKYVVLNFGCLT